MILFLCKIYQSNDDFVVAPEKLIQQRTILQQGRQVLQGLVKWVNLPIEDATWKDQTFLIASFKVSNLLGYCYIL